MNIKGYVRYKGHTIYRIYSDIDFPWLRLLIKADAEVAGKGKLKPFGRGITEWNSSSEIYLFILVHFTFLKGTALIIDLLLLPSSSSN